MANLQQPSALIPPAQLWVGPHEHLVTAVEKYLQQYFCSAQGCTTCITCTAIKARQYYGVVWLTPEKSYTLDDLEPVLETLTLALEQNQHFFFVFSSADLLTPACANRLLKPMEEPPAGYHFILLSQRKEALLQTIQSRCVITTFSAQGTTQNHERIKELCTAALAPDPLTFLKELDTAPIPEQESLALVDEILAYWVEHSRSLAREKKPSALVEQNIMVLREALAHPPMPGSSKLFWKNIFIQLQHAKHTAQPRGMSAPAQKERTP